VRQDRTWRIVQSSGWGVVAFVGSLVGKWLVGGYEALIKGPEMPGLWAGESTGA
jgi:hypothetical protein